MKRLLVIGAGGHGCSVAEAAVVSGGYRVIGFLDDAYPQKQSVGNLPVLGCVAESIAMQGKVDSVVVALGDNRLRHRISGELKVAGFSLGTVVHPGATVSSSVSLGAGTVVLAGAVIGFQALLGEGVIINALAVVDHHCIVGDYGHLGVRAAMAGGAAIGAFSWMRAGSVLDCGAHLDAGCVLAPGDVIRS